MLQETRQALYNFMEQSQKSQRQIAKETGLSTSVISQFLEGTYTGNNDKVAQTIEQYLTVSKGRLNSVQISTFYEGLLNTQEVLFACAYAHMRNDITLVSGDAGAGKTTALEHYTENNTGVIMVTADSCTASATAILTLIAGSLGKRISGNRSALMRGLVAQLKGTNRLIIVDEADHLTLQALQAIRNLNDQAKVGVVLSGNDKIYRQMFAGQRGYEFDQIRTRIIVRKKVVNNYTVEEIQNIFPQLNEDCLAVMLKIACNESLRTARKLFEIALEFSKEMGGNISAKTLRDTQKQLFGGAY